MNGSHVEACQISRDLSTVILERSRNFPRTPKIRYIPFAVLSQHEDKRDLKSLCTVQYHYFLRCLYSPKRLIGIRDHTQK